MTETVASFRFTEARIDTAAYAEPGEGQVWRSGDLPSGDHGLYTHHTDRLCALPCIVFASVCKVEQISKCSTTRHTIEVMRPIANGEVASIFTCLNISSRFSVLPDAAYSVSV